MNYALQCQLLSEGFKHEQIIQEDWEKQKKELRDLYVAGKITERQISTRLARAGMGSLSKNAAYQIAHDPDNVQQREIALKRIKDAEEEKAKRAALAAQAAKHQTRGSAAQAYCDMWNKKFGHVVKAGVVKESIGIALVNKGLICEDSFIDDCFANLYEEVNYIGEENMTEDVMIGIIEEALEEAFSADKLKKHLKRGAIALGATAALGAAPGVVSGAKNIKAQSDARKQAAQEYQMSQNEINAKQNEIAQKIHNTGVTFKNNVEDSAKCFSEVSKICKAFADNPSDPEIDSRVQDCIDKYGVDAYIKSLNAITATNQATAATKSAAKKLASNAKKLASKVKSKFNKNTQVNEEVNYFDY